MWISRGRYPHMSRKDWITRSWLLIRKVINQDGVPYRNDVRVAEVLLYHSGQMPRNAPKHLMVMLEEVIINGPSSPTCPCPRCTAPQEELGAQ